MEIQPITDSFCISRWGWFFSVDIHSMIVKVLIQIVYSNSKPIAYFMPAIITLALWITSVAVAVSHNLQALV